MGDGTGTPQRREGALSDEGSGGVTHPDNGGLGGDLPVVRCAADEVPYHHRGSALHTAQLHAVRPMAVAAAGPLERLLR